MKFSYNWIRELAPGLTAPPAELMRLFTMKTAECEGLEVVGAALESACAARVLSVEEISGGHNRKAVVETERYGTKTVVCGAPNCRVSLTTVYVPVGKLVIEGVESDGMLASAKELGIGGDHTGIVELDSALTMAPDTVIEVDNKSLTHRPDLWGHYGMAREAAAITRGALRDPVDAALLPTGAGAVKIHIEDRSLCPRYSALVFENATVGPSPLWLQFRLEAVGLNAINNIVDVTNYVMAELAQPMHAFDAAKLHGDTIFVRAARLGETLAALNGESYSLDPANLVIADAVGPIALGGVIGGMGSAIGPGTTRIVLESANFNAASVRKTSVQLKLRTDASMRFEKSQDPANTVRGLARAIELLELVSPGIRLVGGLADVKSPAKEPAQIELSVDWLGAKLGRRVTAGEVRDILEALQFGVLESVPGLFCVAAPSWRATKDISLKDDLLEEVGRMIGYDSIAPAAPELQAAVPLSSPDRLYLRRLRGILADQGFTEVYNYSFLGVDAVERLGLDPAAQIGVRNAVASGQNLLRTSLLPGILKNIRQNSRFFEHFRLFEIGREIHKRDGGLPEEIPHAAAAIYSREGDGSAGLFELKRVAECVMPGCEVRPAAPRPFEHPGRAAVVVWRGEETGRLFEWHPELGIEGRAAVLDLDLARTMRLNTAQIRHRPLRRFPASAFDLSVIAALREPVGDIERRLAATAGEDLIAIEFVRQYAGSPLPEDRKSVSYRLTVGAPDRTLDSEEAGQIRNRIIEAMRASGYDLRV